MHVNRINYVSEHGARIKYVSEHEARIKYVSEHGARIKYVSEHGAWLLASQMLFAFCWPWESMLNTHIAGFIRINYSLDISINFVISINSKSSSTKFSQNQKDVLKYCCLENILVW